MNKICEQCNNEIEVQDINDRGRKKGFCKNCANKRKQEQDNERMKQKRWIERTKKIKTIEDFSALVKKYEQEKLPSSKAFTYFPSLEQIQTGKIPTTSEEIEKHELEVKKEFSEGDIIAISRREFRQEMRKLFAHSKKDKNK